MAQLRHSPSLNRVLCIPQAFTPDECQRIIDNALATWREYEGHISLGKSDNESDNAALDRDYRNSTIFAPQQPDEWLYQKILSTIMNVNSQPNGYGFDIAGLAEAPNMMRYEAASVSKDGKAGKYDWHMDLSSDSLTSTRKISYSILLNGGQYEGGLLSFLVDQEPRTFCNQQQAGTMVIFPSYMMHSVSEVTHGTRYALVGWIHGNSFR